MTTPNREYNAVLTRLGSSLLGNGMRNTDHRFEWCAASLLLWHSTHHETLMGFTASHAMPPSPQPRKPMLHSHALTLRKNISHTR